MPVLDWYVVRGTLLPFLDRSSVRQAAFGTVLAMLVSYSAILTLGFGFIGSPGNSIATGALLFALLALLFLLSFRGELHPRAADLFYAGYAAVALLSFLIIADAPTREHLLLVATLSGYVACRSLVASDIQVARSAFERITAVIVLVGAFVTAAEIFRQWDGEPGKPMVFGFNAAGTYFMMALGFLVIALLTIDKPRPRRTAAISALIFIPTVIFAAAIVRHTFLALAGSMFVAIILTERGKRWHLVSVGLVIVLAIVVGQTARYNTSKLYASYILEQTPEIRSGPSDTSEVAAGMPSCNLAVNTRNSIAIRKALARDAIYLIPTAGFVGRGLDSFLRFSCIKAHQVHISILQAAVEFGWLGGFFLVALMGLAIHGLVPLARTSGAIRFILCSLVFCILLSLAHGRISRDVSLFVFLGCAVGASRSRTASLLATEPNNHPPWTPSATSDRPEGSPSSRPIARWACA